MPFGLLSRNILPVPDLAVEIVSPTDLGAEVRAKVREYLEASVSSVWVIYLESREADSGNRGRVVSALTDHLTANCLAGVSILIEAVLPRNIEQSKSVTHAGKCRSARAPLAVRYAVG